MALVGKREINNVETEVHASVHGSWSIQLPADEEGKHGRALGTGNSLDAAVNAARQEIRKRQVKVNVPFKTREGVKGYAHSRHARSTDKILTVMEDGKKEQMGYREQVFKADMPQDVIDHLNEIDEESNKLRAEKYAIVQEWSLDLGKAVDEAITKKAEESK